MLFSYLAHLHACKLKQNERNQRISDLPEEFHQALNEHDKSIIESPIAEMVSRVQSGSTDPYDILVAYSKKALLAHKETNCLTEIMISSAIGWARDCERAGPLAGIPVSLKDTVDVEGWDGCLGYSSRVGKPAKQDSPLIRLLRNAGAVPFVKTNVPITMLSFESASDLFGRTTNPHKNTHSPGGSSGGEAALLAYGGSRIGIGTDVAGSLRVPAHYCGIYTIRPSAGRFVKLGNSTSMPGQEGVQQVCAPMTRTLDDLETFWKAVISMKPWKYDHTCLEMPWKDFTFPNNSTMSLNWGVMWDDGVVRPSPACHRALHMVVDILKQNEQKVFTIHPPSPYEGLKLASQLLLADAGKTAAGPLRSFEFNDPGVVQLLRMFRLPSLFRRLYAFYVRYILKDEIYAGLIDGWHEKSISELWALAAQRESYKAQWFNFMQKEGLDFILTVPNALPAVPHGGMKEGWRACGYSFLFNMLDYTAGVIPITHVDAILDRLNMSQFKPRNAVEAGAFKSYNAKTMDGLPVGVQIVGKRLEEEKVMAAMKFIDGLLKKEGKGYELLAV